MRMTRILSLAVLALAVGCAQGDAPPAEGEDAAAATASPPGAVTADPEHYTVEFENDAIRLLRITYGPGETSVMHHHPANCYISLSDGSWRMTDPDGNVMDATTAFGDVVCGEAEVHLPENSGNEEAELILVEMKEDAAAGMAGDPEYPHAVAADPDHYTVEWENDVVRIVRVRYGPGETSVMHSHPANCVIWIRDGATTFELPSGEVMDVPAGDTGETMCVDEEAHLPTNVGDTELDVVLVELKGRETIGA